MSRIITFLVALLAVFSPIAAASSLWSEDEVYIIKAAGTDLYLTTNVASGTYALGATPELFKIVGSEADGFTLQSASSGKYLGHNHNWNCTDDADAWDIQPYGDGYAIYKHSQTQGLGWDTAAAGQGIYTDKSSNNGTFGVWVIEPGNDPGNQSATYGLITSVDQLSSNATESTGGSIAYLIDGKTDTYWHSSWRNNRPTGIHYLQIDLGQAVSGIGIEYVFRQDASNDHAYSFHVQGTNDEVLAADLSSSDWMDAWSEDVESDPLPSKNSLGVNPGRVNVQLDGAYRYIRIYPTLTNDANGNLYAGPAHEENSNRNYWHLAELQIYDLNSDVSTVLDDDEWNSLLQLHAQMGNKAPDWNVDGGVQAAATFQGIIIQQGHVVGIDLSGRGLSELPTALFAFAQLRSLNLSHNNISGNVNHIAAQLPNLQSLDVSNNNFAELYPAISPQIKTLDISNQTIDSTIQLNLSTMSLSDIFDAIPSILLYDHQNQWYQAYKTLVLTTAEGHYINTDDWAVQVSMNTQVANLTAISSDVAYYGESGSTVRVVERIGLTDIGSNFRATLSFEQGDANFINGVDAADLQATINYAFGYRSSDPFNFTAADTYKDGVINVQDVVCTVNILLQSQRGASSAPRKNSAKLSHETNADASIYLQDGNIILSSGQPVAALSIIATGDVKWNLANCGLQQATSGANVVGYSLNGATLPADEIVIGTYSTHATIHHASLADTKAKSISVVFYNNNATAIDEVPTYSAPTFFDLTGRKLNNPGKGVYIENGKLRIRK